MFSFKKILCVGVLFVIILIVFSLKGVSTVQTSDQVSTLVHSLSQYFNPKVFRAVDAIVMDRYTCEPVTCWKIWTDGFNKKYKGDDGKKIKIIMNWDGFWYKESGSDLIKEGDWTLLK